jgi:hypothetical protein
MSINKLSKEEIIRHLQYVEYENDGFKDLCLNICLMFDLDINEDVFSNEEPCRIIHDRLLTKKKELDNLKVRNERWIKAYKSLNHSVKDLI